MSVIKVIPKSDHKGDGFIGPAGGVLYLFGKKGVLGHEGKIVVTSDGNIYAAGPYAAVEGDRLIRIKSISIEVEEV